ncbi:MAG: ADP-ribosylglycohydrolase family protein, partial [Bacteroidaceae bacterium]|nr:ADP-ribosylglycohydrolase family protein [Bacteroidaceae bacterium]
INQSTGFEDAIRRAVSLGADADTLGAIVGSIAEAIWGIPEDMKAAALSYLDDRMKKVLTRWKESVIAEDD